MKLGESFRNRTYVEEREEHIDDRIRNFSNDNAFRKGQYNIAINYIFS